MKKLLGGLYLIPLVALADDNLPEVLVESTSVNPAAKTNYTNQTIEQTAGTRIATKPIDSSRSVTSIDKNLIEDQGDLTLNEAMRNISGVNVDPDLAGNRSNYMFRGFTIDDDWGTKIDGQMNLEWADFDMFNIERIDVAKGPHASTYGLSDPGGFVNIVTKTANWNAPSLEFMQAGGFYGFHKTSMALNATINDSIASRTVLSYQDGANPALFGNAEKERGFLSQNFMIKLGARTNLRIDVRHLYDTQNYGYTSQLPAFGYGPPPYNLRTNLSSPNDLFQVNDTSAGYQLDTGLTENIDFHHDFRWQGINRPQRQLSPFGLTSAGILQTNFYWIDQAKDYESTDNYFTFKHDILGMKNRLVTGLNFINSDTHIHNYSSSAEWDINTLNPSWAGFAWQVGSLSPTTPVATNQARSDIILQGPYSTWNQNNFGIYLEDQIELTKQLIFNGGVRYNISSQSGNATPSVTDYATTPNVGLTYKILPAFSLYADYAQGFIPQTQQPGVAYAPPQYSEQEEAGFKYIDPDNKATFTGAWYNMDKTNVQEQLTATTWDYVGQVNSNGYELDGSYKFGEFRVLGNWAYTNSKIVQDNQNDIGNRFPSVARQQFGGWLHWDSLLLGDKVGAGIGFTHVGARYGDNQNDFVLPSYTTVDTTAYFEPYKDFKVSVIAKNITNTAYYAGATSQFNIMQGQPFTGFIMLQYKFH